MKIAIAQITTTPDSSNSLRVCLKVIRKTATRGVELVAFPELSDITFGPGCESAGEGKQCKKIKAFRDGIGKAAKECEVWVVLGCHMPYYPNPKKWRNTCLTYNPSGELVHSYDKLHPCCEALPEASKSSTYVPGDTAQSGLEMLEVDSRDGETWRFGITIGSDLRFPQLFTYLRARGADAFIVPTSCFPTKTAGRQCETLLAARAIDNQAYVIAPCQVGKYYKGKESFGASSVVDPCGKVAVHLSSAASRKERQKEMERKMREQVDEMDGMSPGFNDPGSAHSWEDLGRERLSALAVSDLWSHKKAQTSATANWQDRKAITAIDSIPANTSKNETATRDTLERPQQTLHAPSGDIELGADGSWEALGADEGVEEECAIGYAILSKEKVIELRRMVPIWDNLRIELYGQPDGR
ncbi:hypothetical protein QFC22_005228 [Naganishia vaughanmartiniae]|uniref:Uncharacterized protein n=1 Tax=Naganishia vaughanmartiniae TaxID=1424756 RepID=A0ACC2WWD5_9TREE|nr:hypothetical protein QFC22_005228 [Naganishia vaughanmartiniae]